MKLRPALISAAALRPAIPLLADSTVVFDEVVDDPNPTKEAQLQWTTLHNQKAVGMDLTEAGFILQFYVDA